jgi:HSP20 family protein
MDKQVRSTDQRVLVPACSIDETSGVVTLKLEMPGVSKEGLEVSVEGNALTITGRRDFNEPSGTWHMRERRRGNYRKTFTLDETIDRERIEAELADGILIVQLQIHESAKPRRIAIA